MGNLENTEKSGKSWSAEKIIRVKTFKTVVRHLVTQLPQTAAPPHPPHLCSSLSPYRSAKYIQRTQNVQRGLGCLKFKFLPFLPIFKERYCVSKYKMSIVLVLYLYSYLQAGCVCVQGIWLPPQLQLCWLAKVTRRPSGLTTWRWWWWLVMMMVTCRYFFVFILQKNYVDFCDCVIFLVKSLKRKKTMNIHCKRNILLDMMIIVEIFIVVGIFTVVEIFNVEKKYIAIEIIIVLEIFIAQAIFIVVDEARVDRGLITAAGSDFTECHSAAAYLPPRCCWCNLYNIYYIGNISILCIFS